MPVRSGGLAARGVDVVVVGIGLAVERQRVAGAVAVDVHRLQLVHDESVFAVVGKDRAVVLTAEHRGVGVEPGLVEGEGVDVGVAEDFGEGLVGVAVGHGHGGRRVDVADRAAQVHLRAAARVGVGVVDVVGFAQAPRVAADRDAVTGQATRDDAAVRIRGDVVADPQHRRREGADLSQRHQRGRALAHARAAAGQQHQVLGVGRTGVGHRQAQLASQCARCQHVELAVDFGDEHVLRGLREQAAAGAGVDVEVVAVGTDAAATRVEVDVRSEHVDGVAHPQVGVGERVRSAIGVEVVVSVDDGARTGHQRHVTCGRRDVMNAQGAPRFLDEDAARRVGFQHAALRHVAHRVEQVGFEEIPGRTNACGDRFQCDVDAGHVRFGVGQRIDDGRWRSQRHVVRVRRDAAHAHVAGLLGQRDEAVGQHVDVAAVDDLGDAGHVHLRRARRGVERVDDDVAAGRACARGNEARAAVQRVDEVVGALDRHARHRAAEEADIDAAAVGPAIGVVAREVRYRADRGRAGAGMHAHTARRAGAGFENGRLQDQVGVAAAGQAGSHQVDVEDMRVGVDVARIAELRRRVAQAALEVDEVVGTGLRHQADAVGDRQRRTALGDAVRALLEVRGVDRNRDVVVSVVERRGQADAQVVEADHVVDPAIGEAAECRRSRARVVDDGVAGFERVSRVERDQRALHDVDREVVLRNASQSLRVVADRALRRVEREVAGAHERGAALAVEAGGRHIACGRGDDVAGQRGDAGLADRVLDRAGEHDVGRGQQVQVLDHHHRRAHRAPQVEGQVDRGAAAHGLQVDEGLGAAAQADVVDDQLARRQVRDRHTGVGVGKLEQGLEVVRVGAVDAVVGDLVRDEQRLPAAAADDVVDDRLAVRSGRHRRADGLDDDAVRVDQHLGARPGRDFHVGVPADRARFLADLVRRRVHVVGLHQQREVVVAVGHAGGHQRVAAAVDAAQRRVAVGARCGLDAGTVHGLHQVGQVGGVAAGLDRNRDECDRYRISVLVGRGVEVERADVDAAGALDARVRADEGGDGGIGLDVRVRDRHRDEAGREGVAVRVGAQVRDLRVQVDRVGLDVRAGADGRERAVAGQAVVVDRRVGLRVRAGTDAAAVGGGVDVRVDRRIGQDRDLPFRAQRDAVAGQVGLAEVGDVDGGLHVGGRNRAATGVADVAVAAAHRLGGDIDVAAGIDQRRRDPRLRIVGDVQRGRRHRDGQQDAAGAAFGAHGREAVASRRRDQPQRGAARPEQLVVARRLAGEVDVDVLRAAGRRQLDACGPDGVRAAAADVAHVERSAARRGRHLELARVGVDHVVGHAVHQAAQRLAHQRVLHGLARIALVGRERDHAAAQQGRVIGLGGQQVAGDRDRVAGDTQDRQGQVVAHGSGDDDLLSRDKAVARPVRAVVAHDRVGGARNLREGDTAERRIARHQLHLAGIDAQREVRCVVAQPADRRAVAAVGDAVAGVETRVGEVAIAVAGPRDDHVVVDADQRLAVRHRRIEVGVLDAVGVDELAGKTRGQGRVIGHRLPGRESAEVDEAVAGRTGHGHRRGQRRRLGGEQLDGRVVDDAHVVRAVRVQPAKASRAARRILDRVAVLEQMRALEANAVAHQIDTDRRLEQIAGRGLADGAGVEAGTEFDRAVVDHDHVVVAPALQRRPTRAQRAVGGDRRVARAGQVGDAAAAGQTVLVEVDRVGRNVDIGRRVLVGAQRLEGVVERGRGGLGQDLREHVDTTADGHVGVVADVAVHGRRDVCVADHHAHRHAAEAEPARGDAGLGPGGLGVELDIAGGGHDRVVLDRGDDRGFHVGDRRGAHAHAQAAGCRHRADDVVAGVQRRRPEVAGVDPRTRIHARARAADLVGAGHHRADGDRADRAAVGANRGVQGRGGIQCHVAAGIDRSAGADRGVDLQRCGVAADAHVGDAGGTAKEAAPQREAHRAAVLEGLDDDAALRIERDIAGQVRGAADLGEVTHVGFDHPADTGHRDGHAQARAGRDAGSTGRDAQGARGVRDHVDVREADGLADVGTGGHRIDVAAAVDTGTEQGPRVAAVVDDRHRSAQTDEAAHRAGKAERANGGVERGVDLQVAIAPAIGIGVDAFDHGAVGDEGRDVRIDVRNDHADADAGHGPQANATGQQVEGGVVAGVDAHVGRDHLRAAVDRGGRAAADAGDRAGSAGDLAARVVAVHVVAGVVADAGRTARQVLQARAARREVHGDRRCRGGVVVGLGELEVVVVDLDHEVGDAVLEAADRGALAAVDDAVAGGEPVRLRSEGVGGGVDGTRANVERGHAARQVLLAAAQQSEVNGHRHRCGGVGKARGELEVIGVGLDDVIGGVVGQAANRRAIAVIQDAVARGEAVALGPDRIDQQVDGGRIGIERGHASVFLGEVAGQLARRTVGLRHHVVAAGVAVLLVGQRVLALRVAVAVVGAVGAAEIAAHGVDEHAARQAQAAGTDRDGVGAELAPRQRVHVDIVARSHFRVRTADDRQGVVADDAHVDARTHAHRADADRTIDREQVELVRGGHVDRLRRRCRGGVVLVDLGTADDLGRGVGVDDLDRDRAGHADVDAAGHADAQREQVLAGLRLHRHAVGAREQRHAVGVGKAGGGADRCAAAIGIDDGTAADHRTGFLRHQRNCGCTGATAVHTDTQAAGNDPRARVVSRMHVHVAARGHLHVAADVGHGVGVHHHHGTGTGHAREAHRNAHRDVDVLLLRHRLHFDISAHVDRAGEGRAGVRVGREAALVAAADPGLRFAQNHRHRRAGRAREAERRRRAHARRHFREAARSVHVDALAEAGTGVVDVDVGARVDVRPRADVVHVDRARHRDRDGAGDTERRAHGGDVVGADGGDDHAAP